MSVTSSKLNNLNIQAAAKNKKLEKEVENIVSYRKSLISMETWLDNNKQKLCNFEGTNTPLCQQLIIYEVKNQLKNTVLINYLLNV